jgi:uncharacterized membrane protein
MKNLFGLRELKFLVGLLMIVSGIVGMVYSASIEVYWNHFWEFTVSLAFSVSVLILGLSIAEKQWMGVKQ